MCVCFLIEHCEREQGVNLKQKILCVYVQYHILYVVGRINSRPKKCTRYTVQDEMFTGFTTASYHQVVRQILIDFQNNA